MQIESADKYSEQHSELIESITDEFRRIHQAPRVQFWQVIGTVVVLLDVFIERF
uniref:Uncharacterized protein n=1 Tax=Candidatus Kentrum sp. DK TaxID=2126562 RepID=A0A450SZ45_9GAMM|nr:MAG: hypothetical protein BECKDK2373B_GA0170837_10839 [Candidatus Kentron sp. DK]